MLTYFNPRNPLQKALPRYHKASEHLNLFTTLPTTAYSLESHSKCAQGTAKFNSPAAASIIGSTSSARCTRPSTRTKRSTCQTGPSNSATSLCKPGEPKLTSTTKKKQPES